MIKAMMRTLLADRFKLVFHRETREAQMYTLTVGNNGPKLQESKDGRRQNVSLGDRTGKVCRVIFPALDRHFVECTGRPRSC